MLLETIVNGNGMKCTHTEHSVVNDSWLQDDCKASLWFSREEEEYVAGTL